MADELKHKAPGRVLTQAEYEALDAIVADGQTLNDLLYFDGTNWIRATAATIAALLSHQDLANRGVADHHDKYTDAEAVAAVHDKYLDSEAIAAIEGEATLDLVGDVTIDGAKSLKVDVINEKDSAAGVTVETVVLKDGLVDGVDVAARDHAKYLDAEAVTAAKTVKLDDFTTPDDNTDLDASGAKHGLMPKADASKLAGIASGADVTGSNAPQAHAASHQNSGGDEVSVAGLSGLLADDQHVLDAEAVAAAKTVKLDDFATPDDNTDLDFGTARHGLVPKGPNAGDFLKDDGTWAAAGGEGTNSDYQEFTGSGTWTKPAGTFAQVYVECIGGGGGGGGGEGRAAGSSRFGGGGGGGGARRSHIFDVTDVGATETVTIGAAGSSGDGGSSANGSGGSDGGDTTFGSLLTGYGGHGGDGGGTGASRTPGGGGGSWGTTDSAPDAANADQHGALGSGSVTSNQAGNRANWGGSAGGIGHGNGLAGQTAGSSVFSGGGGGGGGGLDTGNVEYGGAAGGNSGTWEDAGGGAAGATNGGAGTAGAAVTGFAGTGGGSGGGQDSGTGGAGGTGGAPGGGGGGGGGGTTTGGAGGAGSVGECRVWTI